MMRTDEPPSGTSVARTRRGKREGRGRRAARGRRPGLLVVEMMGLEPTTPCLQISVLRAACQALFLQVAIERCTSY